MIEKDRKENATKSKGKICFRQTVQFGEAMGEQLRKSTVGRVSNTTLLVQN